MKLNMQTVLLRKTFEIIVLSQQHSIIYKKPEQRILLFSLLSRLIMGNRITSNKSFLFWVKLALLALVLIFYFHYFFPQNWGFFTVKPIQPMLKIYEVHDGIIQPMHNNMSYGLGISRKGRITYHQLSTLSKRNINLTWRTFTPDSLSGNAFHNFSLINGGKKLSIKGKFIIIKEEQLFNPSLNFKTLQSLPREYTLAEIR